MSRNTVTICSVFFQAVDAKRDFKPFDGSSGYTNTPYHIDACARGEHKTLVVQNHFQRTYIADGVYNDIPVYAEDIGSVIGLGGDLVNQWASNVIGGTHGGPGIFVCAGDAPTPAEIERATARQTSWADHLCTLAEIEWINGRKLNIDSMQRQAAEWLGRANEYEWVSDRGTARAISCPMCARSVPAHVVVCPECKNVVDFGRYQHYLDNMARLQEKIGKPEFPPPPPAKPVPVHA